SFVPEVPGDYTVIVSFDGTKSFWGSSAVTAIAVEDAAPAPTDEPKGDSIVEQYFVAAIVGIIIAIIVVGIVIILMLRKR
ncbi:MAG: hypothetical protein GX648_03155, partial [Crenarchaeota archaeon]|nr:hypothetical protein [Thermoproteota archaeon]